MPARHDGPDRSEPTEDPRPGGGGRDRDGGDRRGPRRDDRRGGTGDGRGQRRDGGRRSDRGGGSRDDRRGGRRAERGSDRETSRGPATPGEARGRPVGADRARRRDDAPPRRARAEAPPARPDLPPDEEPNLPKSVRRELERTLGPGRRTRDVALALSIGSEAIDTDHLDVALEVLAWAKHSAPRVAAIREAYGIARYLSEDFGGALTELQAYARISGRVDQHHLIADCHRALGRDLARVEEAARTLLDADRVPEDRRTEAAIVLAAAYADAGQLGEGRAVLREVLGRRRERDEEHDLRARSLAADLALRAGDRETARRELQSIAAHDPAAFDAEERLAALEA